MNKEEQRVKTILDQTFKKIDEELAPVKRDRRRDNDPGKKTDDGGGMDGKEKTD